MNNSGFFMGNSTPLMQVMNEVSSYLDKAGMEPSRPVRTLDEFEAFVFLDPLLAGLRKQFLDAKANRQRAVMEYGADDGMAELAAMLEDSAWCAMQTRYMELRADRGTMKAAQDLLEEALREQEEKDRLQRKEKDMSRSTMLEMTAMMRKQAEDEHAGMLFVIVWMLIQQGAAIPFFRVQRSYDFNRLAA